MHANGPEQSVAIVGMGLATPLGSSLPQTWDALLADRSITDHSRVPITFESNCGRANALALRVAREAIAGAGWNDATLNDRSTALVVGTSKGPVERWLTPLLHMDIPPYVTGGLHPIGLGEIAAGLAAELRLGGPRMTLSAACASGLEAMIRGTMMIRGNEAQRVLVVAVARVDSRSNFYLAHGISTCHFIKLLAA